MATERSTGKIMKTGVILAAVIIVLRIILEHLGAPSTVNAVFGVAWLYFLLPVCLALRIAATAEASPFKGLFLDVLLFGVYTRLMVMLTYMIAYFLKWKAPRFSASQGGVVGDNVTPLMGLLVIPARNAVYWIIFAVIVGMILGGITLLIARKPKKTKVDVA